MSRQAEESGSRRCLRAGEHERVTVCVETIKANRKAEFDHLLRDVLGPAGLEINGKVFENTRLIEPQRANDDGTWSYVSILDPVIADGDYSPRSTLERKYGKERGGEYARAYRECYAAPVVVYRGVQVAWAAKAAA